ncbi:hypothetical protein Tco_0118450, partial [Tanacetum coccineum]
MSDSEHSTVTYTSVSFPVEDNSDIGSQGVNGPPIMPEDLYAYIMAAYQVPPSPDYIPGPEVPPSPDYIPGPEESHSHPPLDLRYSWPRSSHYLLLPHPLQIHQDMFLSLVRRRTMRIPKRIPPVHRMTARISIRDEPSISLPPREEVKRLLTLTTPPPSPLTPLPSPLPHIPSPPFPA